MRLQHLIGVVLSEMLLSDIVLMMKNCAMRSPKGNASRCLSCIPVIHCLRTVGSSSLKAVLEYQPSNRSCICALYGLSK